MKRNFGWAGLSILVLALLSSKAQAETRLEGFGGSGFNQDFSVHVVEADVHSKFSLGLRQTDLGVRDTQEVFLRWVRTREHHALDPKDNRKRGMNNPESLLGSIHLGLVGVETNGARGLPTALRVSMFQRSRISASSDGIMEFGYQTGTMQQSANQKVGGGLFSRFGLRKTVASNFYAAADYVSSPGVGFEWRPNLSLGMKF